MLSAGSAKKLYIVHRQPMRMDGGKNVLLDKKGGYGVAVLTINRPQAMNALNRRLVDEMASALETVGGDPSVKVVIITGAGDRAFVAGADIAEMKDMVPPEALEFARKGHALMDAIENMEKPVIAAVNGFALGGGDELALACDVRIASKNARFGQPEIKLGITLGWGGTRRLTALVGPAKAKELIFTGAIIDADEALRIGLVNKVVEPERLMDEALSLAGEIAEKSPLTLKLAKHLVNNWGDSSLEKETFSHCFSTRDQKEGMAAFLEKRKANFEGK